MPEWYLLPFYAILRAITFDIGPITAKLGGVIAMFGAIAVLFVLPWLDTSKVRSLRYRPLARQFFFGFVFVCLMLGIAGASNPDDVVIPTGSDKLRYELAYEDQAGRDALKASADSHEGSFSTKDGRAIVMFDDYEQSLEFAEAAGIEDPPTVYHPGIKWLLIAQLLTFCYFAYFLIVLPLLGLVEKPKDEPETIAKSIHPEPKSSDIAAAPAE